MEEDFLMKKQKKYNNNEQERFEKKFQVVEKQGITAEKKL